ncbi:hypothetical protein ATN79_14165 [Paraburkholderia caribensis]|nr:hypothetical protein ATN79_14165 [Paraburkholderia caribensis]
MVTGFGKRSAGYMWRGAMLAAARKSAGAGHVQEARAENMRHRRTVVRHPPRCKRAPKVSDNRKPQL